MAAHAPDLPRPIEQYEFAPPRKFRADFAFVDQRLLVECEGGVWIKGKHGRGSGVETDCEKARQAAAHGFRVFRVTTVALRETPDEVFRLLRKALSAL